MVSTTKNWKWHFSGKLIKKLQVSHTSGNRLKITESALFFIYITSDWRLQKIIMKQFQGLCLYRNQIKLLKWSKKMTRWLKHLKFPFKTWWFPIILFNWLWKTLCKKYCTQRHSVWSYKVIVYKDWFSPFNIRW